MVLLTLQSIYPCTALLVLHQLDDLPDKWCNFFLPLLQRNSPLKVAHLSIYLSVSTTFNTEVFRVERILTGKCTKRLNGKRHTTRADRSPVCYQMISCTGASVPGALVLLFTFRAPLEIPTKTLRLSTKERKRMKWERKKNNREIGEYGGKKHKRERKKWVREYRERDQ